MATIQTGIDLPLEEIASLRRRYRVPALSLVGSALRDDVRDDSDIDLLFEIEPGTRDTFMTLDAIAAEREAVRGQRVDLVPKSGPKVRIRDSVAKSARVTYAA